MFNSEYFILCFIILIVSLNIKIIKYTVGRHNNIIKNLLIYRIWILILNNKDLKIFNNFFK